MNNTRKEIIELIESYMEKELSEVCLILLKNIKDKHEEIIKYYFESDLCQYREDWKWHILWRNKWYYKILWHYDITAVERCIMENWCHFYSNGLDLTKEVEDCNAQSLWTLLLKPLHLYTEEEEKDLLVILNKLWTNKKWQKLLKKKWL